MSKPRLPPKKDVALALLQNTTLFLHLDPRHDGVRVPPWFKHKAQLVLQVGLNMAVPIPDLAVDDAGISCTLSFNRAPHYCVIPWPSVYALVGEDGRGMVWPDDVPPEVAAEAQAQQARSPNRDRSHLRAVSADTPEEPKPADTRPKTEVAAEPRPRAVQRSGAGKPSKKKNAVLAAPAPSKRRAAKSKKKEPTALPKAEPAADTRKGKRELPPYLRVVK